MKPGWKTSEFWITMGTKVLAVANVVAGPDNPWVKLAGVVMAGLVDCLYVKGRADVKNGGK